MDILSDVKRFCMCKHVNISGLTFQQNIPSAFDD